MNYSVRHMAHKSRKYSTHLSRLKITTCENPCYRLVEIAAVIHSAKLFIYRKYFSKYPHNSVENGRP